MNGILIIDKPRGWTSHDVVNKARRVLRERRIGHTGTLDPLATGVLVLCVGRATRIVRYLESADKEYLAECRLGVMTDTQDADGRVLETRSYAPPSRAAVEDALAAFHGDILQRPPRFSALKVQGVPSHRLARTGVVQELAERKVTVRDIGLLDYDDPSVRFRVACSKGTYVRTLCSDLGLRLGCGAHLAALVRTRAGRYSLAQALSIEQLAERAAAGRGEEMLISMDDALGDLPGITVTEPDARKILHGNPVSGHPAVPEDGSRVRLRDPGGSLIAIGLAKAGAIRPEVVLA